MILPWPHGHTYGAALEFRVMCGSFVCGGWTYVAVIPWDSADGRRRGYRLFLLLPGSKELAYHGIL